MMFGKILGWAAKEASGLNWLRIGMFVGLGLFIIFTLHFVWVARPNDFYNQGKKDGIAEQNIKCEKEKKEKDDAIQLERNKIQKKRAEILSRPRTPANITLERMYMGAQ